MKKKSKKILSIIGWIIIAFSVIALILFIIKNGVSTKQTLTVSDERNKYIPMKITIKELSFLDKLFLPKAIMLTPTNPKVGEQITVDFGIDIPYTTHGVEKSRITLSDGTVWNVFTSGGNDICNACTAIFTSQFYINVAGNYWIKNEIIEKDTGITLTQETKDFTVGSTTCPLPNCGSWRFLIDIDFGERQTKDCYTYEVNTCVEKVSNYYKTICNSGYVIEGTTLKESDGQKTCVKEIIPQKCSDPNNTPYGNCTGEIKVLGGEYCNDGIISTSCSKCGCLPGYECNESIDYCRVPDLCKDVVCEDNNSCTDNFCIKGDCNFPPKSCGMDKLCVNGNCIIKTCTKDSDCEFLDCKTYSCLNSVCEVKENIPQAKCSESIWNKYPDCTWDNTNCLKRYYWIPIVIVALIIMIIVGYYSIKKVRK